MSPNAAKLLSAFRSFRPGLKTGLAVGALAGGAAAGYQMAQPGLKNKAAGEGTAAAANAVVAATAGAIIGKHIAGIAKGALKSTATAGGVIFRRVAGRIVAIRV